MLVGQTRISAGKAVIYQYEFSKNSEMVRIDLNSNLKSNIDIRKKLFIFCLYLYINDIYPIVEILMI